MIFLLTFFSLSLYIPFSLPNYLEAEQDVKLNDYIKANQRVIVLTVKPSNSWIIKPFLNLQSMFPNISLYVSKVKQIKNYTKKIETPFLSFFRDGDYVNSVGPIKHESVLLNTIDLYLNGNVNIVNSQAKFMSSLNDKMHLTIGCYKNDIDKAVKLAKDMGKELGPISVIGFEMNFARSIGLNFGKCIVYRIDDDNIEEFDCTNDGLRNVSKPYYQLINEYKFQRENATTVALITPQFTNDIKDFLYQIGKHFPDFNIVYVTSPLRDVVKEFTHDYYDSVSNYLVVLNYKEGWIYNVSSYITREMTNDKFSANNWRFPVTQLLYDIRDSKVQKTYQSEGLIFDYTSPVRKIVGTIYKDYINDTENDCVMLYLNPNSKKSRDIYSSTFEFVQELRKQNKSQNIKFGFISPSRNSIEGGFPSIPFYPYIYIFPAGTNKIYPVIGNKIEDIKISLMIYSSFKH